ncbi:hypothetical protein [Streptomyces sp. AC602_WCS936]|uniref:hypothetical protein n=1 Tax=Streptomyces sp. AC602_WCS936 TaxID=2823685 RepID=UPI001C274234|nr:hypothetical protein [Streptomyces sp. AC602_WCS936]
MNRRARVLPLLLTPLLLTACGTEKASGESGESEAPAAAASEQAPPATGGTPGELKSRAEAMGTAPELVYVTTVPGFTLAEQSVGVLGDDGFSAAYTDGSGAVVRLGVERGSITGESCRSGPVGYTSGGAATCERDAGTWYRTGGGEHEYAVPKDGHVLRLSAETDSVPRAVLREAAESAHRPDAAEAAETLPSPRPDTTPVERGDLPPFGDGAPDNSVDIGG